MSLDVHTVTMLNGSTFNRTDRVLFSLQASVANAAGSGAGAAVTVPVAMSGLPASYGVFVNPGQDAAWFVSAKTNAGFTVTLNPRLAANTLAAGTIDILLVA